MEISDWIGYSWTFQINSEDLKEPISLVFCFEFSTFPRVRQAFWPRSYRSIRTYIKGGWSRRRRVNLSKTNPNPHTSQLSHTLTLTHSHSHTLSHTHTHSL